MSGWKRDRTVANREDDPWHRAVGRIAVRAAALALSALFVAQVATASMALPQIWLAERFDATTARGLFIALAVITAAMWFWMVGIVSAKSHFDLGDRPSAMSLLFSPGGASMRTTTERTETVHSAVDPARDARVYNEGMWTLHPMVHRLRRIHFGIGILIIAAVVSVSAGLITPTIGVGTIAALGSAVIAGTTLAPENQLAWVTAALLPLLSLAVLVGSLLATWFSDGAIDVAPTHNVAFAVALWLGVSTTLCLVAGGLPVGALAIGAFLGASMGGALGMSVDLILGTEELLTKGTGWVAVVAVVFAAVLVIVALVVGFVGDGGAHTGQKPTRLRRAVLNARIVFYAAGTIGLGVFAFAIARVLEGGLDTVVLGETEPNTLVWGAVILIFGTVGFFAFRSIRLGSTQGDEATSYRRKVGILWDLGSFWPRWYHPLAPPAYGPFAVKKLSDYISNMPPDSIVSAHSQGSLIAAVAIDVSGRPVNFITSGSQLGLLYPRMFPSTGIPELVEDTGEVVQVWTNLWRTSDAIGGQYIDNPAVVNRYVDEEGGHSGYETTATYNDVRRGMVNH